MSALNHHMEADGVDKAMDHMKIEEMDVNATPNVVTTTQHTDLSQIPPQLTTKSESLSPSRKAKVSESPKMEAFKQEEVIGGQITLLQEPGEPPKLSRKASQRVISRPPLLYNDLPDATEEATQSFQVIRDCIYGSKYMGAADQDAYGCDCSEEWRDGENTACGPDSDCINRHLFVECLEDDCSCGSGCQNRRFQSKTYAQVSVIKTEKKGYGLRADTNLEPGDLIFEYIGEVINEPAFRRRTIQYHEDGIKHFYFMSLNKSEFIDATRKGNLGRFCNHSCNPNCEVQKWIVGDKVRMGIFAERSIQAGEELVFNYNVDRYGADPQPCYCGEPNCTGFLGGKTQTERATKLSHTFTEALGIEDGDGWDTVVAKKPRKRKTGEDDEEYVNNVQVKGLDENGVSKVMAALMQCTEKWIAVKLLNRIQQRSEDKTILTKVVAFHGYQILKKALDTWKEDNNIVLQILEILYKLPRFTRNKIVDSKIEASLEPLTTSEHEDIASESQRLLKEWAKLEVAYRIPRKKFDPSAQANSAYGPRREETRVETPQSAPSMPTIVAPTGPKSSIPQRGPVRQPLAVRAPPVRRPLPSGWFVATSTDGKTYYYNRVGDVTWQRPTIPSVAVPKVEKQKTVSREAHLQSIIDAITREKEEASSKTATPKPVEEEVKVKRKPEKWRSLPIEKQMKLYENTLAPAIRSVMDRYRKKLPKDDLKRFAKEISKKMVSSDYKHNRVEDPTNITERHEKKVKGTVKEFFDKAVVKRVAHEKKKAEKLKEAGERAKIEGSADAPATLDAASPDVDDKAEMSDVDFNEEDVAEPPSITTPSVGADCDDSLKRKRDDADEDSMKRLKSGDTPEEEAIVATPPPPPPPSDVPPALEDVDMADEAQRMEEEELRIQQEELERENEEAERLEQEEQRKGLDGAEAAGNLNVAAASSIGIVNGAEQSTGFLEDPGMAVHTEEGVLSH